MTFLLVWNWKPVPSSYCYSYLLASLMMVRSQVRHFKLQCLLASVLFFTTYYFCVMLIVGREVTLYITHHVQSAALQLIHNYNVWDHVSPEVHRKLARGTEHIFNITQNNLSMLLSIQAAFYMLGAYQACYPFGVSKLAPVPQSELSFTDRTMARNKCSPLAFLRSVYTVGDCHWRSCRFLQVHFTLVVLIINIVFTDHWNPCIWTNGATCWLVWYLRALKLLRWLHQL